MERFNKPVNMFIILFLGLFIVQQAHSGPAAVHNEDKARRYKPPMFGGDNDDNWGFCSPPGNKPNVAAQRFDSDDSCEINPGELVDDVALVGMARRSSASERLASGVLNEENKVRTVMVDGDFNLTVPKAFVVTIGIDESLWWFLMVLKWGQLFMGLACLVTLLTGIILEIHCKTRRNKLNYFY